MAVVQLGPLELSCPLGVGTNSWGDDGAETDAVFRGALDVGVNFFDTAEYYKGSEEALGAALRNDGRRAIVCTKYLPMPWHCNVEWHMLEHLEKSLRKLGLEQVDLLYIHLPISLSSIEVQAAALAKMVKLGKCRAVGVSNFSEHEMRQMHAALKSRGIPLAANQVEFSLLRRLPESNGLLRACQELNVCMVAWCPFGDGRLCTPREKWHSLPADVRSCAERLAVIAERHGKSPTQIALNWCIRKGAVPLAGTRKQANMMANAGALGWQLSDEDMSYLDECAIEDSGTFNTKGLKGKLLKVIAQHG